MTEVLTTTLAGPRGRGHRSGDEHRGGCQPGRQQRQRLEPRPDSAVLYHGDIYQNDRNPLVALGSAPTPAPQPLTVIGMGLTCTGGTTSLNIRLDGIALPTTCAGNGNRQLNATVPSNMLVNARRFALDVADSSGNVTNAEDLTVEQSVDVSSTACPTPEPSGVSIDPEQNLAAVTLYGCNNLALINLATGTGAAVGVGTNPIGVAVIPRLHVAVVANNGGPGKRFDRR